MDYPPHDLVLHATSSRSKQAAPESDGAPETIEWEQTPSHSIVD